MRADFLGLATPIIVPDDFPANQPGAIFYEKGAVMVALHLGAPCSTPFNSYVLRSPILFCDQSLHDFRLIY